MSTRRFQTVVAGVVLCATYGVHEPVAVRAQIPTQAPESATEDSGVTRSSMAGSSMAEPPDGANIVRTAEAPPLSKRLPKRFTLTISGGLSLGNYEAGMNWALINERKRPDANYQLSATAGASAGAINAMLSALEWCSKTGQSTASSNLFKDVWLPVGFENMLPANSPKNLASAEEKLCSAQAPESSEGGGGEVAPDADSVTSQELVFSRSVSHCEALGRIRKFIKERTFRRDCAPVKMAFSVTGEHPQVVNKGEVKAGSNYYVIPLKMSVVDGKPQFESDYEYLKMSVEGRPRTNGVGLGAEREILPLERVFEAVVASSAFPVAFGPVKLRYRHIGGKSCVGEDCSMYFSDGGIFDNVPLKLAQDLDLKTKEHLYFDPAIRRHGTGICKRRNRPEGFQPGPMGRTLRILAESLLTARGRVLYDTLSSIPDAERVPTPSRFSPITGTFVGKFGAWFDPGFRKYDYWAGVYDGLAYLAWNGTKIDHAALTTLIQRRVPSSAHRTFLSELQQLEFNWKKPSGDVRMAEAAPNEPGIEGASEPGLSMLRDVLFSHHLDSAGRPRIQAGFCNDDASFDELVRGLDEVGYAISRSRSPFLHAAKGSPDNWWLPLAARAVDRLAAVEESHWLTQLGAAADVFVETRDPQTYGSFTFESQQRLRSRLTEHQVLLGYEIASETGDWRWGAGPYGSLVANAARDWRLGGHLDALWTPNPLFGWWFQGQVAYGLHSSRGVAGIMGGLRIIEIIKLGLGAQVWLARPSKAWSQQSGSDLLEFSVVLGVDLDTLVKLAIALW